MISVIVPVYCAVNVLERCVESMLVQDFRDFELILVDDGSPDGSGKICDRFAAEDGRVRVVHQENAGVSSARNAGIRIARGRFIAFADSDDWVAKDCLSSMLEKMRDGVDMVICLCRPTEDGMEPLPPPKSDSDKVYHLDKDHIEEAAELFSTKNVNSCLAKLFRSSVIRDNHLEFEEDVSWGEDTFFNMDYFRFCRKVVLLEKYIYSYIVYPISLTRRGVAHVMDRIRVNRRVEACLKKMAMWNWRTEQVVRMRRMAGANEEMRRIYADGSLGVLAKIRQIAEMMKVPDWDDAVRNLSPNLFPRIRYMYGKDGEYVEKAWRILLNYCILQKNANHPYLFKLPRMLFIHE